AGRPREGTPPHPRAHTHAPSAPGAGAHAAAVSFRSVVRWGAVLVLAVGMAVAACGNDPYPGADTDRKIVYLPFSEPPKTLDPQVAYSTTDHVVTGAVHDRLLEYHFLDRPYHLIPGLALAVPTPEPRAGGHVVYRCDLCDDVRA